MSLSELKRENEDKEKQMDDAAERERQQKECINALQCDLKSLGADHGALEEKRSSLEEEKERLSRELSVAQERVESLDLGQQNKLGCQLLDASSEWILLTPPMDTVSIGFIPCGVMIRVQSL